MGFSLNQINLIGKLGRDAETRFVNDKSSVTNFSMVTEHSFKNKDGEYENIPTWHNIVAWNLSDYHKDALKKGVTVHVGGRIETREWTDKDGNKRYTTEVIAEKSSLIVLDNRNGGSGRSTNGSRQPQDTVYNNNQNDDLPF